MDINTKLIIKVQFNDEIRKMPIHNEDITYDELIIMMERVFKHRLNAEDEIIIKYKDEDNDLITISDDSDLAFAIESSNILKLSLTIENDTKEGTTNNNDLNTNEITTIRKELQNIRDHVNRLLDRLVVVNGETALNTITSGRTSAVEGKVFQEIGGKEFDPLSVSNHAQFPSTDRSETSNSLVSNSRNEDIKTIPDSVRQNNQDMHSDSKDGHDLSPAKNQNMATSMAHNMAVQNPQMQSTMSNPPSTMSSNMAFNQNKMQPNVGGQNIPQNMGGQNLPPNMGGQNMPPNMGGQNMPPNMGGQNMPPNMGGQNLPPNMGGQNMPPNMNRQTMSPSMGCQMPPNTGSQNIPPNMGVQNMPHNMGGTNMPPNMGGQNMPPNIGNQNMPPNMGGQSMLPNMGGQNMPPMMGGQIHPPNMVGSNIPKTNENAMHSTPPSAFTGNPQPMMGQLPPSQRHIYPNPMQPPRISPSNFQGPGGIANPGASQIRPQGYQYPQNPTQFNPAMSQPNLNYGYQSSQN